MNKIPLSISHSGCSVANALRSKQQGYFGKGKVKKEVVGNGESKGFPKGGRERKKNMINLISKIYPEGWELTKSLRRKEQIRDILMGICAMAIVVLAIVILILMAADVDPFVIRHWTIIGG